MVELMTIEYIGFFSFSAFLGENVLFRIPTELSKTPFNGG